MATTTIYEENSYKLTEEEILRPLREATIARKIFPVKTIVDPSDLIAYYYEQKDDLNINYTLEPYDTPRTETAITETSVAIPVIHGELSYSVDEYARVQKSRIPVSNKVDALAYKIAYEEERICLAGDTPTSVTSVSTTGTNSTAASTELNTVDFATFHSTLTGLIGQLIDNNIPLGKDPLILVITPDVYKNLMGRLNTDQNMNGVQFARSILKEHGGPGSELFVSKFLGATWTVDAKKGALTAGTSNAVLFDYNSQYYEVIASPIQRRSDGFSKVHGWYEKWVERWRPIYKKKEAIIYSGTVANA